MFPKLPRVRSAHDPDRVSWLIAVGIRLRLTSVSSPFSRESRGGGLTET